MSEPKDVAPAGDIGMPTDEDDEHRRALVAKGVYQRFRQRYSSGRGVPPKRATAAKKATSSASLSPLASSPEEAVDGETSPSKNDFFMAVARIERRHAAQRAAGEKILPPPPPPDMVDGKWRPLTQRNQSRSARTPWKSGEGIARGKTGSGPSWWDPQPIGKVLDIETHRRGWKRSLTIGEVTANWDKIVGPQVAEHCPIESFEGGTLVARASSTAWAQQLQLLLPLIHKRIDEMVGAGVVEKVLVYPPEAPSWGRGYRRVQGRGPRDTYG